MSPAHEYRLGIEETGYALGVIGGEDVASEFLLSVLGDRSRKELEGRLFAAAHSLVARNLVGFDRQSGKKWLDPDFERILQPFIAPDFMLRCSRASQGEEQLLSFNFAGDSIISHHVEQDVVSCLESISHIKGCTDLSAQFFSLTPADLKTEDIELAVFPHELLDSLREKSAIVSSTEIVHSLIENGVPSLVASGFAEDIAVHIYRGSIIRLERREDAIAGDKGFIILQGQERFWLLDIVPADEQANLRLFYGTMERFQSLLESLLF